MLNLHVYNNFFYKVYFISLYDNSIMNQDKLVLFKGWL